MILASGILLRSSLGTVLFLKRSAEGDAAGMWAFPGGKVEDGETLADAAVRETLEETGYDAETAGQVLTRRVADGVDYTTFVKDVGDEFIPKLNNEHTAYMWMKVEDALAESATGQLQ